MSLWNYSDINKKDKRVKNFCRESTEPHIAVLSDSDCLHCLWTQPPASRSGTWHQQSSTCEHSEKKQSLFTCFMFWWKREQKWFKWKGLSVMRTEDILAPLPGITTLKTYVNVTGSCLVQCSDKQYCSSVYMIVPAILCCRKFLINPNPP